MINQGHSNAPLATCVLFGLFFVFSNFYRLEFHNKMCVASTNLWWRISKICFENQSSLDFDMFIETKVSVYRYLTYTYVLPIVFIIECGVVNNIWNCCLISFKHVSLWCLFFIPHQITHHSNIGSNLDIPNYTSIPTFLELVWMSYSLSKKKSSCSLMV